MNKIYFDNNPMLSSLWENTTFEIVLKFFIIYLSIIWISIIIWVIKDITNRTSNFLFQLFSIFLVILLSPLWVLIYLIIRPWRTLYQKYYDEIDSNLDTFWNIIKDKTNSDAEKIHCHSCREPVWMDFNYCPYCKISLSKECNKCNKKLYAWWTNCPYCWKECKEKKVKKNKEEKKFSKKKIKKDKHKK